MMRKGASKINCKNKFWYKGALGAWSEWWVRDHQYKIAKWKKFWYKGALGAWSEWCVWEHLNKIAKINSDIKALRSLIRMKQQGASMKICNKKFWWERHKDAWSDLKNKIILLLKQKVSWKINEYKEFINLGNSIYGF